MYLLKTFKKSDNVTKVDDCNTFRWAAANGHLPILKYLRDSCGYTSDDCKKRNCQAFHYAAPNGHLAVLKYLKDICGYTDDNCKVYSCQAFRRQLLRKKDFYIS